MLSLSTRKYIIDNIDYLIKNKKILCELIINNFIKEYQLSSIKDITNYHCAISNNLSLALSYLDIKLNFSLNLNMHTDKPYIIDIKKINKKQFRIYDLYYILYKNKIGYII